MAKGRFSGRSNVGKSSLINALTTAAAQKEGALVSKVFFFFTLVTGPSRSLSLKLSDTRVYGPQTRGRLSEVDPLRLSAARPSWPPWRQPRGKWMVSLVNSHTNATSKRWHLWEIDLRCAPTSTPGWVRVSNACICESQRGFTDYRERCSLISSIRTFKHPVPRICVGITQDRSLSGFRSVQTLPLAPSQETFDAP